MRRAVFGLPSSHVVLYRRPMWCFTVVPCGVMTGLYKRGSVQYTLFLRPATPAAPPRPAAPRPAAPLPPRRARRRGGQMRHRRSMVLRPGQPAAIDPSPASVTSKQPFFFEKMFESKARRQCDNNDNTTQLTNRQRQR